MRGGKTQMLSWDGACSASVEWLDEAGGGHKKNEVRMFVSCGLRLNLGTI